MVLTGDYSDGADLAQIADFSDEAGVDYSDSADFTQIFPKVRRTPLEDPFGTDSADVSVVSVDCSLMIVDCLLMIVHC